MKIVKPYYGHPILFYLYLAILPLNLVFLIFTFLILNLSPYYIFVLLPILLLSSIRIYIFNKKFCHIRNQCLYKVVNIADLKGNEKILDLGTGSGFIAINLAKYIDTGCVYGIDNWKKLILIKSKIMLSVMIGTGKFFAERNVALESVQNRCVFINQNITEKLNFPDEYFDIICSSFSLYFIKNIDQRRLLYYEMNRTLKKRGKIILVEPKKSDTGWDVNSVKTFFKKIGYSSDQMLLATPNGWVKTYILYFKK